MIRSEKTRQFIIEKSAPVFNKKGYTGTYMSDLTKVTGLTKGSIYGNFKDKNEVAIEVFRFNFRFQTEKLNALMNKEERADKKLFAFLNYYKKKYEEIFANGGCAILNTAVEVDDGDEVLKGEVVEKINNWIATFTIILNNGVRKNEIQKINTKEYAQKIIATVEGSILLSKTLNQPQILLSNIELLKKEIKTLIK